MTPPAALWLDAGAAAWQLADFIAALPGRARPSGVQRAIGIAGAPGLGKTTMSRRLTPLLGDATTAHLDHYLLPRQVRRALGVSGVDERGHDLIAAGRDMRRFLERGEPLMLREYLDDGTHGGPSTVARL